jgi:hypothetical protein
MYNEPSVIRCTVCVFFGIRFLGHNLIYTNLGSQIKKTQTMLYDTTTHTLYTFDIA